MYSLAALGGPRGGGTALGAVACTVSTIALHLLHLRPGSRRRLGPWPVLAQTALAGLAVLPFGMSASLLGFPAAALLLLDAAPLAVLVVGGAVTVAVVRAGFTPGAADVAITAALIALVVYSLTTLADRVAEVSTARLALAMSAVAEERLRIAAELTRGLGDGLAAITAQPPDRPGAIDEILRVTRESLAVARRAAAEFRSLSLAPEATSARALLSAAGIEARVRVGHTEPLGPAEALLATVLREAVTDVVRRGTARYCEIETAERNGQLVLLVTNDGVPTAADGIGALEELAARVAEAGGRLTAGLQPGGRFAVEVTIAADPPPSESVSRVGAAAYRQSVGVLVVVLAAFSVRVLSQVQLRQLPVAVAFLAAICVLQVRWARRPSAGRPSWWVAALIAQAALSYLPILWLGKAWGGIAGGLAGSLLVALPAIASWLLVAVLMLSLGALAWAFGEGVPVILNSTVSALVTGLIVYGLVRLAQLVDELQAAGERLARAAVVQERLRAARDLHDLLGHTLAAILLKCELAKRLFGRDQARARAELDDVLLMAERARSDMRTVTGGDSTMSLRVELDSVRSVLAAAGVAVKVESPADPIAEPVDTVLSVVLREAVTNVLRHSAARHCRIAVSALPGSVRLTVENDGASGGTSAPGAGIGNLTTRLAALGGTLVARADGDGWFRLSAEVAARQPMESPAQQESELGDTA
ncbi:two-component sensor histidine kinase [Solihabitans fulvus]|uniref:Two-component sensor histidine kinase n=1 Tax=Solihabitans fulvus TaxID=1892852 RepID=A0A5B2XD76_9PSEU|nr:two-component sensor histidine kinase [Solihabitans fulvus]